ncbi:cytochrome ubiquinol oxidase subunit I [Streptomyces ruber]|uniref:Cytochrome ubiquinol oxidase subunit I n=2 Tax=Streptomyces TaxID=1883 RepID=A0A918BI90_9ACTN|nr:cytochrome ubiquinol oxidase subunit I [Streptomyces ruber]GGQ68882.1 cytochrome ubiquinol oxidase subunit I [Streptomyces ruber]
MSPETIARWQFGITTVYHYLFVPLTISLAGITAGLETAWVRTRKEKYFHATKFWGKLFLINMAMGVVTGIVQEFQFGMDWSAYSRFVGDVFGVPLAMEAIIAFFFESTFIGLWIFGWDRLPRRVHCFCIWMVSLGTILSAYFILAANSWMQHPVGYVLDHGRARLTDFPAVLFQPLQVLAGLHAVTASFITGGALVTGISAWHLLRARRRENAGTVTVVDRKRVAVMRTSLRVGLGVLAVAGLATLIDADSLGQLLIDEQPLKMAAGEGLWNTVANAPFSVFALMDAAKHTNVVDLDIPYVLSFLAHHSLTAPVTGINDAASAMAAQYGGTAGDYLPNITLTYWSYRAMILFGMTSFAVGVAGLWLTRNRRMINPAHVTEPEEVPHLMLTPNRPLGPFLTRWAWRVMILTMLFPLVSNSFGWIFTETGRQPWVVYGLLRTSDAVSPGVSAATMLTTLIGFTALYAVLAVIEVGLMVTYAKAGPHLEEQPPGRDPRLRGPSAAEDDDKTLTFAY